MKFDKRKLFILFTLLLGTVVFGASACGSTTTPASLPIPTPTPSLFPLELTDANGNNVVIEKPPTRIISIDSDSVEILFAIGEGHRLIATHDFVDHPPETANLERVGGAFALNLEQIVQLEPDLVYIFFDRFLPNLEKLGLKVLYLKSLNGTLSDVTEHFYLWGQITGNTQAARDEVEKFDSRLAAIRTKLNHISSGPRVYHHTADFWAPGGDTLIGNIYELLKVDLVTKEISGFAQINPEEIVAKEPEVIVTDPYALQQIENTHALLQIPAVKDGRIAVLHKGSLSVAGPRLLDAIEELAEIMYPDLFP